MWAESYYGEMFAEAKARSDKYQTWQAELDEREAAVEKMESERLAMFLIWTCLRSSSDL